MLACLLGFASTAAPASALQPLKVHSAKRHVSASARLSGSVIVDFHSDPGTCAAVGRCGVSGRTTWTPSHFGLLDVWQTGRGKKTAYDLALTLGGEDGETATTTRALVERVAPDGSRHVCSDQVDEPGPAYWSWWSSRGRVPLRFSTTDISSAYLMRSRCAGPVDVDVERAMAVRSMKGSSLMRGDRTVTFSSARAFSAKGLAGTVHTSLTLRLGRADRAADAPGSSSGGGGPRFRVVTASYRVAAVDGGFSVAFAGAEPPSVCSPFDSCGVSGGVDVTPGKSEGTALLTAYAPASRPARDVLAALGLSASGNPQGVEAYGQITWSSPHGVAVARLSHADGGAECHDQMPVRGGIVALSFKRRVAQASFSTEAVGLDPVRSRCAGPLVEDGEAPVATASFPAEIFNRSSVVLDLSHGMSLGGGPFTGTSTSTLTMTLTRVEPPESYVTR